MIRLSRLHRSLDVALMAATCLCLLLAFDGSARPDPVRHVRSSAARHAGASRALSARSCGRAASEHGFFDDDRAPERKPSASDHRAPVIAGPHAATLRAPRLAAVDRSRPGSTQPRHPRLSPSPPDGRGPPRG